ncbi:HD domain-containing phosphohydrolase [Pseudobacteriovorax antillogorgiicola]|uniref:FHA domain-containing protein n=1 Tax=Pseudobacteriovorax antillogorgiicola TaxID=1513793 RepID=A0A1Y6B5F5_9BACT|nr:HD domain-containing phosphohydrolase [Pseudobacteriovorax antillogorgiicola]TCS59200.1 FHA domain-containing protein [Pseudobacteriovorax antillogorgiicola]SME90648.1 FHA domain-containing protein [Pseudobacteriovorax antillogorgiicola]
MTFLAVERGKEAGKRYELQVFPATIGRDPKNVVVIADGEASRYHFRIKQRGRLYILEDLESRNGTYVNGDRVINTTLKGGDKILLGSTELIFFAPDSEITIPTDFLSFDMQIDEKAGIKGPIGISEIASSTPFIANRLDPAVLANNVMSNESTIKQVFNYHSNLMVIRDLNEMCSTLLKSIGKMIPNSSRAALFIWSEKSRQLLPFAKKDFQLSIPFQLSQRAFEDCLSRKQVVLLEPDTRTTQSGRNRAIMPITHNDSIIALIHVEIDNPRHKFRSAELEAAQALLFRASPIMESLLLRREIDSWLVGIMDTIIATVEAKDTYTRGHSERVANYCMAIADELKLNKEIKRLLMISALCHDIGKIGIPDSILKKASLLSAEEYAEMKLHPTIGASIISHLPNAQRIISGVKYHHEKWDGTGYPDGLAGEDIPFFGRIVALGDVYDAMISGRSYSGFVNEDDAIERIHEERELFDPEILRALIRAHEKGTLTQKTSTQNNALAEESRVVTEITKIK